MYEGGIVALMINSIMSNSDTDNWQTFALVVVFGGRILKDDKSLADYCIKEGSTLHILRRTVIADKSDMSVEMESLEQDEDHQISNRQLIDNLVRHMQISLSPPCALLALCLLNI